MPTFVLNDENVINSYGFRVRNAGINLTRFASNPVMLDSHINETSHVMGKWKNWRIEGTQLKMDTVFDSDYDEAKRLEGQVDRGFVNGASPGLAIDWTIEPFERQPDGSWDLIHSEMTEGTICGVPSNSGALQLYDKATNEPITEDQIKLSLQKLTQITNPNNNEMKEFKLSAPAMAVLVSFGLSNAESESEINEAVVKLNAALADQKKVNETLQGEITKQLKLSAEKLVDDAILAEKITAGDRDTYVQLAQGNFELTAKIIASKPGKVSLSNQVNNSNPANDQVKTIDDFEKLSDEKKLAFKSENPAAYKLLFAR